MEYKVARLHDSITETWYSMKLKKLSFFAPKKNMNRKGPDMTFWSQVGRQRDHFRCIPSMLNWISMLSWVPRDSRNIDLSKTTLLCTIYAPFSVREGLKNVILWLLAEVPLTPPPPNLGPVIRYCCSFLTFLIFKACKPDLITGWASKTPSDPFPFTMVSLSLTFFLIEAFPFRKWSWRRYPKGKLRFSNASPLFIGTITKQIYQIALMEASIMAVIATNWNSTIYQKVISAPFKFHV